MTAILIKFQWNYIRNNYQSFAFLLTLIAINVILFVHRLYDYSDWGWLVMLARANGQCLNFTCSFIIVCVFRRSITKLRSMGFSEYLPLDHHVYFHKLIGWAIVFFSLFHTAMHVVNFRVLSKVTSVPWMDFLFSPNLGIGWIGGLACLTGWLLLALLIIMMIAAQPFIRRSGKFEVSIGSRLEKSIKLIFNRTDLLLHSSSVYPILHLPLPPRTKLLVMVFHPFICLLHGMGNKNYRFLLR